MNTTDMNYTTIDEIMQLLMRDGTQAFPDAIARMYNIAMQFDRERHLEAKKYEKMGPVPNDPWFLTTTKNVNLLRPTSNLPPSTCSPLNPFTSTFAGYTFAFAG